MKHLTEKERGILICLNESEDTWRPPIYKDDIKEFLATIDFLRQESAIWEKQSLVALVNERDLLLKEVEALREAGDGEIEAHVIEKSAYDALASELEFSKLETAERESMNRLHLKTMKQLESDIDKLRAANAELVEALTSGQPDYNSAWSMICLMAEGEGSDAAVYQSMAKAVHAKLKSALAKHGGKND